MVYGIFCTIVPSFREDIAALLQSIFVLYPTIPAIISFFCFVFVFVLLYTVICIC